MGVQSVQLIAAAKRVIPRRVRARIPETWVDSGTRGVNFRGRTPIHVIHIGKTGGRA